jgi:uncharacterized membrane protein
MNWLLKNFLRGLIIVVPIAMTIYILYEIVDSQSSIEVAV